MTEDGFKVCCQWDDEALVWYVHESNVPGLTAEAATFDEMNTLLSQRIPELLLLNMPELFGRIGQSVPFDLIGSRHQNLRLARA